MDTTLKKLNLGCGEDKKEGYVNVDFHSHVKPDVVHDLNVVPYPFAESTFDLVEAILRDPFRGIGKPEPLKYVLAGAWSRRVTEEHRLVYLVSGNRIDFLQARYHY